MTLRLRGSKTELEEMGEDVSDMATTTSQLQAKLLALTGGQVDIMTDANTFKNSTQILREMAEAWEDMTDIQRASALELMGGKRQANVLSALIQNFDTVENVIETSANSAGSALEENERYLDSIQGKIDQFNNAMQAMWSHTLDSDMVKGFVALGTEIIKIVDKIGLLNTALIALATYSMIKNKTGPIAFLGGISDIIRDVAGKVGGFIGSLTGMTAATSAYTAETLAASVANGTLSASEAASIASKNGLALATTNLTAAEAAEMLIRAGVAKADALAMVAKLGLTSSTQALSLADIQAAVSSGALTTAQGAQIASALGLTVANKGLAASFMALWTALWPILAVMAAIAAIYGIVKLFDLMITTTSELREDLSELKSELSDIESQLESLNGELETTQERMAELLAKDSLTFTEQEELENLQKQNDLLERELYLLEQREKRLQKEAQKTFDDLMDKETKEKDRDGDGEEEVYDKSLERKIGKYEKWVQEYEEAKQALVEAEKSGDEKEIKKAEKKVEKAEKKVEKWQGKVDEELNQYLEDAEGIDYDSADEETRKYLDYIYNTEGRLNILNGEDQAKTVEIKRIFNKEDMSGASDEIDKLVDKLVKNPGDETIIAQIGEQCKAAEKDLKAVGLSVQDATDYFTKLGTNTSFDTLEGKVAEMAGATSKFQTLLSDTNSADFTGLFDEDGEVLETAIAEYFQGTSEATREEIAKIVKNVNDGKISVDTALKQFELFGIESTLDIQIKEVQTNFKDVFVDLEDADGLINTFEELGEAIGSTVGALDALNKAQGEMDYSGRVSIQTALELMQYTDNYADVLEVVDGKLQLNKNAEENLINARITAMKVSAQTALADAQAAYEKAKLATQTYNDALTTDMSASVVAKAWEKVLAAGAGLVEGIKSLFTEESWTEAYNRAYNETLSNMTGYETTYDDAGLQALVDAEADAAQAVKNAQGNVDLLNGVTADNINDLHESDDIEDPDDAKKTKLEELMDAFQREMDYWENRIGANQARYEQLQNEIDLLEAKGQKADASFYEEQIELENQRLFLLGEQKKAALEHLATLEEGSEEWWEVANVLNGLESDIDDVTASIVDLQDAIGEIDTYKFEEFNNRLDDMASKLGTIRDLIAPDEEDWFDAEGNWTEEGVAVLGTYIQELETYKQGLAEAEDAYANYVKEYAGNETYYAKLGIHSEQELYDKRQELIEQQYDYAKSISDTEQSVVDMYESNIDAVEEYTETLIDSYNDYIDSVKEALEAERDLYDFKKNVQKQSKDIAAIERRIASLSGSTNASDIAERRKLEAQLYESRESLNDTYYDHAKNAQSDALDAEAQAYEESMTKFVEGLRISLEQASLDMDLFLGSVTAMVSLNAGAILTEYQNTGLELDPALTTPWVNAKNAVGDYSGDALDLMNQWTQGGFFTTFPETVKGSLTSPWSAGSTAASAFKTSVSTVMEGVVSNISTNVKTASGELSKLYQQIKDTEKRAAEAKVVVDFDAPDKVGYNPNPTSDPAPTPTAPKKTSTPVRQSTPTRPKFKKVGDLWSGVGHTGVSIGKKTYNKALEIEGADAIYYPYTNGNGYQGYIRKGEGYTVLSNGKMDIHSLKPLYQKYAKGTTGTDRDEWAITDEPQFGDELVLVPGKDGNLSFMRKGTGVVPADMTQKLFELAQIPTSDLMNKNLTAIVPNITKNDFKNEFNFDSLVHVDKVDSDTLPKLEKMVDKKIDDFSKALNYSLKRFAR